MSTIVSEGRSTATVRPLSDLVAANAYLREIGRSRVWLWRLEKAGLLHPINVLGKLYLSRADIAAFEERARKGELAKNNPYPRHQLAAEMQAV